MAEGDKTRSYSQLGSMDRCPYMYYLERVEKVWQRPAAWLPMGTAVHEAVELWELSGRTMTLEEVQNAFRIAYARECDRYLEETPNTRFWFASGPYRGADDIIRRWHLGQEHVERYIRWYQAHPTEIPLGLEGGKIAVELPFTIDLEGVKVRGFIDWVGYNEKGNLIVRDNKTGRTPGGPDQLATYALAVESLTGSPVNEGDFFMTRTGKPTVPYQLTRVVKTELIEDFGSMDAQVKAGNFPAKPSAEICRFCSVSNACKYKIG